MTGSSPELGLDPVQQRAQVVRHVGERRAAQPVRGVRRVGLGLLCRCRSVLSRFGTSAGALSSWIASARSSCRLCTRLPASPESTASDARPLGVARLLAPGRADPRCPRRSWRCVGTIMMRPSLVQIGRSRTNPTGRAKRDDTLPGALGCLLTSPPSEPVPPTCELRGTSHSPHPGNGAGLRDSITARGKEKVQAGLDRSVMRQSRCRRVRPTPTPARY